MKKTIEEVQKVFEKSGCKLIEKVYKNNRTPMSYVCFCGNTSKISLDNFQRGRRCKKCRSRFLAEKFKLKQSEVADIFEEQGCELIGEYSNANKPVAYRCRCGCLSKIRLSDFKISPRCKQCSIKARSGENHPNWNSDRDLVKLNRKLHSKSHKALKRTLDALNEKKNDFKSRLLGFTTSELYDHLSKFENWDSLKESNWHLDHVFPIKAFLDYGIDDVGLINSLSNIQPLSEEENLKKGDNYCSKEFEKWLLNYSPRNFRE